MAPTDYSLADVAALTETPVRTIRYYISQGLLPSSGRVGPAARYDDAFVARLRAIRQLQERHLPLAEIRKALEGLPDASVINAIQPTETPPSDSAADYVRRLLGVAEEHVSYAEAPPALAASAAAATPAAPGGASIDGVTPEASHPLSARFTPPDHGAVRPLATPAVGWSYAIAADQGAPAAAERSHWERIAITPDIEIHLRRPLSRPEAKRAERLIEAARDIFDKGA